MKTILGLFLMLSSSSGFVLRNPGSIYFNTFHISGNGRVACAREFIRDASKLPNHFTKIQGLQMTKKVEKLDSGPGIDLTGEKSGESIGDAIVLFGEKIKEGLCAFGTDESAVGDRTKEGLLSIGDESAVGEMTKKVEKLDSGPGIDSTGEMSGESIGDAIVLFGEKIKEGLCAFGADESAVGDEIEDIGEKIKKNLYNFGADGTAVGDEIEDIGEKIKKNLYNFGADGSAVGDEIEDIGEKIKKNLYNFGADGSAVGDKIEEWFRSIGDGFEEGLYSIGEGIFFIGESIEVSAVAIGLLWVDNKVWNVLGGMMISLLFAHLRSFGESIRESIVDGVRLEAELAAANIFLLKNNNKMLKVLGGMMICRLFIRFLVGRKLISLRGDIGQIAGDAMFGVVAIILLKDNNEVVKVLGRMMISLLFVRWDDQISAALTAAVSTTMAAAISSKNMAENMISATKSTIQTAVHRKICAIKNKISAIKGKIMDWYELIMCS